jgi:hypothetical protein
MSTSSASYSGAVQALSSPSRNSGPVAGNQPILYSPTKSVGYLDEYVRFMQTKGKRQTQHKRFEQVEYFESNANLSQALQEAIGNGGSGQSGTFKMEVVGKKSAADFSSYVVKGICASSQDSLTLTPLGSIQKSAVGAESLGSNSLIEVKHHMVTNEHEHEEVECEKVKIKMESGEIEAERIKADKVEEVIVGVTGIDPEKIKTEEEVIVGDTGIDPEKIKTETVSVSLADTTVSMMTTSTFVSGAGCEELNRVHIAVTGLESASDMSEVESHNKLMNAVGGLLELTKKPSVGTAAGIQDASCHSVQDTVAALQKYAAVSVTPISSLKTPMLSHDMKLDTGQPSTQPSDTKVPESLTGVTTSKDISISGHVCNVLKVDIPCMGSKVDKPKSEPKPQTEFRIQINRKNEMYLCNTETGEIKPLNTVKPARKWSRCNPRSTSLLAEPSNVAADSKRTSLGLPAHPVQVVGSRNIVVKSELSQQVVKTAHVNIPVCGISCTPADIPKPIPAQLVSKPGSVTFPGKPVTPVSKLSQSEMVLKPSHISNPSRLITPPHVPKIVIARKPMSSLSFPSKGQSTATVTTNQKPNRRKPKYIIHNALGKVSRHTLELQEALDSCVESMLATEKDDNSLTLFGPGNTYDTVVQVDESFPDLIEGTARTSDVTSSRDVPHMTQSDKHWPSLGHEVTVETTDATPPLLEVSPPLLEPASSHQLTSSSEEGSSQPPQLTPESNASIRTASTTHVTPKNRKCKCIN